MLKLLQDTQLQLHIKYTEIITLREHKIPYQSRNNNIYRSYITDGGKQSCPPPSSENNLKVHASLGVFACMKLYQLSNLNP